MQQRSPYRFELSGERSLRAGIRKGPLDRAARSILRGHGCRAARIGVALVTDAQIADLNQRYLAHRGPTDVLTFPMSEAGESPLEGEIVISIDRAAREAAARGHAVEVEVLLYLVHGLLHLLGYEDKTRKGAQVMHAEEARVLAALGYAGVYAGAR